MNASATFHEFERVSQRPAFGPHPCLVALALKKHDHLKTLVYVFSLFAYLQYGKIISMDLKNGNKSSNSFAFVGVILPHLLAAVHGRQGSSRTTF